MAKQTEFILAPEALNDEARAFLKAETGQNVCKAFEIGVSVFNRVSTNKDMDFVKGQVDLLMAQVTSTIESVKSAYLQGIERVTAEKFDPALPGSFTDRFGKFMNDKAAAFITDLKSKAELISAEVKRVEENTSEKEGSSIARMKKAVTDVDAYIRTQFDGDNIDSYTYQLQKALVANLEKVDANIARAVQENVRKEIETQTRPIVEALVALRETIAKEEGKAEIIDKTSGKGFTFEEALFEKIQAVAEPYGEAVESTGLSKEVSGSQKGDFLYTTKEKEVIVIEAKDKPVLRQQSLEYMKLALDARGSKFGILVCKLPEQLQKQIGRWQIYDNTILCCADDIEISIKIAKMKLQMENVAGEGVNVGTIKTKIASVISEMKKFVVIKKHMTNMVTAATDSSTKVGDILDDVASSIMVAITEIEGELKEKQTSKAA